MKIVMTTTAKSEIRMYVSLVAAALLLTFFIITDATEVAYAAAETVCNGSCDDEGWGCGGSDTYCTYFVCCPAANLPCGEGDITELRVCFEDFNE